MAFAAGIPTQAKADILAGKHMDPVTVTGTISGTTAVAVTAGDTKGMYVGQSVSGSGIPAGTTVDAITGTTSFTLSQASTNASGVAITVYDKYMCALYTQAGATGMNATATVYGTTGEIINGTGGTAGYTAGGVEVARLATVASGTKGVASFANPTFATLTTPAGGVDAWVIYNASQGNKIIEIGALATPLQCTAATGTITMPTQDSTTGVLRLA